jgi:23S rRNA (cytidine1920-2'-O)/16S rRNA (cytidine1409-2'-O)-methyltransferase
MKKRLDAILVEKGLATGRDKAKALVMAGLAYVDGERADKPGLMLPETADVEVRGERQKYASRGGYKLEKAINAFNIDINGKACMDIGASTGGFTDCMLQNGAKKVYAVDVGYGQLAWQLRTDKRVVVMERTNIRHVTREQIAEPLDFISVDVSVISLRLVLPAAKELLAENGEIVCLIKPQFEAGRGQVGKKGVVRDKSVHVTVITDITDNAAKNGFAVLDLGYSPIKGPEGNIEYLMHLRRPESGVLPRNIDALVDEAHAALEVATPI